MPLINIITLILTFTSLSVVCFILSRTVFNDLEGQALTVDNAKELKPIEHFISQRKLTMMQITYCLISSVIVFCLLVFADAKWIVVIIFSAIGGLLAFWTPFLYYARKVTLRNLEYESKILDFVLGINNGLRSGIALPQALEIVGRDIGGVMQEELNIALYEYRLGVELTEALQHMHSRMPNENMQLLITSIALTQKSGGSLSDILGNLVVTIRQRTSFQAKVKTLTAQGKFEAIVMASAPFVAFVFLYILDSNLMYPLLTTPLGIASIVVVLILEAIGFFIIKKIITIEV